MAARLYGLRWLWVSALFFGLDQLTKYWISSEFRLFESRPVTGFFNLVFVHNPGAAFSFLSDAGGWQRWLFSALALVVSGVLLWWLKQTGPNQRMAGCGYALVLSGALGNLCDRILHGHVIDFLDFYVGSYHWPAFNVADSAIFVGAALLIIDGIRGNKNHQGQESA
jgi:signal peptidase II